MEGLVPIPGKSRGSRGRRGDGGGSLKGVPLDSAPGKERGRRDEGSAQGNSCAARGSACCAPTRNSSATNFHIDGNFLEIGVPVLHEI